MSTPRERLHALIDELPDEAAEKLLSAARRIKLRPANPVEPRPGASTWPPAWFGSITTGPANLSESASAFGVWPPVWFGAAAGSSSDVARRSEEILRAELGRDHS